jgi:hypothetical protein
VSVWVGFVSNAIPAARGPQVLAQQLSRVGIEQPHVVVIPLHLDSPADPARRRAVISGLDFDTAVQVHRAFAVLVIAESLDRRWEQRRTLFSEHCRNLPFRGAMDARVGPALFPAVQIDLRLVQALEAQPFQGCLLCVPDTGFDLTLAIRVLHPAGQSHGAIVLQHVTI